MLIEVMVVLGLFFALIGLASLANTNDALVEARPADPRAAIKAVALDGPNWCDFEVAGESYYQAALRSVAGEGGEDGVSHHCRARLVHEYGNPHDANAIRVEIEGLHVGYLPAHRAGQFRKQMQAMGHEGRDATCAAFINGGWSDRSSQGHYGVKLGLHWPVRERTT